MSLRRSVLLLLLLPAVISAYNHPELEWKSVTTDHFIITYYDRTEPAVYATWKIAEESYRILSEGFKYQPREKISISLADYEDFSNGFAEWTAANIQIWLPDLHTDLRSNTTWLRNVITHELTHILSLEQKRRIQTIAVSLGLGISTPDEEIAVVEPIARISAYPMWLVEGITQYETERLGNDCYDSRREMALRGAVLSDNMLTLDEMGSFNHDGYGSEMVYNQGFAFTKFIASRIGTGRLHALFSEGASEPIDVRNWFTEKAGTTLDGLYGQWVDSLRTTFAAKFPGRDETVEIITREGRYNLRPEVSPDGKYWSWLSSGPDDAGRTDLVVAPYGSSVPLHKAAHAHTAHCFSAASDKVYFVKSRVPARNGSIFNELYSLSLATGAAERLTVGGRIYDVAALPGGDLLCIRYVNGVFGLYQCDSRGGSFRELVPGEQGAPLLSVAAGGAGTSFAVVSKIVSGRSRLLRYSFASRQLEPLSSGIAQEESPFIAPGGRIYFNADYDGVFNVYSCRSDGGDLLRHTSTAGGHFSPKIAPDGACVSSWFSQNRFRIVRQNLTGAPYTIPENDRCLFSPLPVPKGVVTIKSRPYEAKLRRSVWEVFLNGQVGKNGSLLTNQFVADRDSTHFTIAGGFQSARTDALQKRIRVMQLMAGVAAVAGEGRSANRELGAAPATRPLRLKLPAMQWTPPEVAKVTPGRPRTFFKNNPSVPSPMSFQLLQAASGDSDSTVTPLPFAFVAMPGMALENHRGAPTVGMEMQAQLMWMFLPGYIGISPYFEMQLGREWYCGGRINLDVMPLGEFPLSGTMPLYLLWNRVGYINEDISYNFADVTQMQLSTGPRFVPSIMESGMHDDSDTAGVAGWMAQLSLYHGIPLLKYGALQLISSTSATYHGEKTLDDGLFGKTNEKGGVMLDGESNGYLLATNGVRLVVPIARTINRGSRHYLDALYGHVGYALFGYVNSSFFDSLPEDKHRLFTDPGYRAESVILDHALSVGVDLGRYKSHLFFSTLSFEFTYFALRSEFHLSLTSGL